MQVSHKTSPLGRSYHLGCVHENPNRVLHRLKLWSQSRQFDGHDPRRVPELDRRRRARSPGGKGVFEVSFDDDLIFSKKEKHRFPEDEEMLGPLRDRL